MPDKRSPEAIERRSQRYAAKKHVWKYSFKDFIVNETVSRTSQADLHNFLQKQYGSYNVCATKVAFRGLVLEDGKGKGAFQ